MENKLLPSATLTVTTAAPVFPPDVASTTSTLTRITGLAES